MTLFVVRLPRGALARVECANDIVASQRGTVVCVYAGAGIPLSHRICAAGEVTRWRARAYDLVSLAIHATTTELRHD